MSEHREALADIVRICSASRRYTRRTQQISEVAMVALGMTANQRHNKHMEALDRVGDQPDRDAYLKRKQQRDERAAARAEEVPA